MKRTNKRDANDWLVARYKRITPWNSDVDECRFLQSSTGEVWMERNSWSHQAPLNTFAELITAINGLTYNCGWRMLDAIVLKQPIRQAGNVA